MLQQRWRNIAQMFGVVQPESRDLAGLEVLPGFLQLFGRLESPQSLDEPLRAEISHRPA